MTNGVLQATDVVKSYNKKEVLHSVSLTIEPGKIYGLIGRNGAGKTTLLSILTAQNTHDSGLVTYNGERVWGKPESTGRDLLFPRAFAHAAVRPKHTEGEGIPARRQHCTTPTGTRSTPHD